MLGHKTVSASFLSACALAAACLLSHNTSARIQASAGEGLRQAGAPLKGVDVKLGRYAGAQPGGALTVVAQTTTDADGKFKLPVVPAGRYVLVFELPKDAAGARKTGTLDTKIDTQAGGLDARTLGGLQGQVNGLDARAFVTLKLPGDKTVEKGYDFAKRQAFDPLVLDLKGDGAARAKGVQLADFVYESDGVTPCEGAINTTRSNIKNSFE